MTVILLHILASILAVTQQPVFMPSFVSVYNVTQFSPVREYGSIGLLAHDYSTAGRMLPDIIVGNLISVTLSNGDEPKYVVTEIVRAQSLQPYDPYSRFILDGREVTSTQLILSVFRKGTLTLQTCEGVEGRIFVIAERKD